MNLKNKMLTLVVASALVMPSALAIEDSDGMHYTSASEGFYASLRAQANWGDSKGQNASVVGDRDSSTSIQESKPNANDFAELEFGTSPFMSAICSSVTRGGCIPPPFCRPFCPPNPPEDIVSTTQNICPDLEECDRLDGKFVSTCSDGDGACFLPLREKTCKEAFVAIQICIRCTNCCNKGTEVAA